MTAKATLPLACLVLMACDAGTEERREVTASRAVMRPNTPIPPGARPRGTGAREAALATPGPAATPALLRQGEDLFLAFCSPCHGAGGAGDGPVVQRGFPKPPSYHQDRLREAAPGYIVSVVTNGLGKMYPYAARLEPHERWAVAHYVKALQANGPPSPSADPTPHDRAKP